MTPYKFCNSLNFNSFIKYFSCQCVSPTLLQWFGQFLQLIVIKVFFRQKYKKSFISIAYKIYTGSFSKIVRTIVIKLTQKSDKVGKMPPQYLV
jgi:hypothetical protein